MRSRRAVIVFHLKTTEGFLLLHGQVLDFGLHSCSASSQVHRPRFGKYPSASAEKGYIGDLTEELQKRMSE
jgi:hypothetical protein